MYYFSQAKVNSLCQKYNTFNKEEKTKFLSQLSSDYGVDHDKICQIAKRLACNEVCKKKKLISIKCNLTVFINLSIIF